MKHGETNEILEILSALRRRVVLRMFLSRATRSTLFFYGVLVILTAVAWHLGALIPDVRGIPFMLTWPFVLGAVAAILVTAIKLPTLRDVALLVDGLGNTRDRLVSALDFSTKQKAQPLEQMAAAECEAWLNGRDFSPLLPIRVPGELRWLIVPLAAIALLWWSALDTAERRQAAREKEQSKIAEALRSIEKTIHRIEENEALRSIAERMKESVAKVREEADRGGEATKTALREIAKLEDLIKEMRRPEFATLKELKAIADALAQHEQTREAAKDIANGNLAAAAEKLLLAAEKPESIEAQESLKSRLDQLAEKGAELSRQLDALQKNRVKGGGEKLLQQIAETLKQGGKKSGKTAQSETQKLKEENLKKLLSELQEIKSAQQQAERERQGMQPSGQKSETGKTPGLQPHKNVFVGNATLPLPTAKNHAQLSGHLGEGESLEMLMLSASEGDTKARIRYKNIAENAAAEAADAVMQEEIPPGSRHLIREYFEAIRPQ